MKFSIDPPSGYPNSYLDIKFTVEFDTPQTVELRFDNETTGQELRIITTTAGHIRNETVISASNVTKVEGYFNLFNDDRMNTGLDKHSVVTITCYAIFSKWVETAEATFYNEAKSLDASVIPFDLRVINPVIHVDQNEPLQLSIVSSEDKKYEIAIKSEVGNKICTIEAMCRKGQNTIIVPCAFLYSDLRANEFCHSRYLLHCVKFEGLDFNGYVARHYIPISGANISFVGGKLMPPAQSRNGPDGQPLSSDFVLSDRYLVPTYRDFTSFGRRMENVVFVCNFGRFIHEMQDLQERQKTFTAASVQLQRPQVQKERFDLQKGQLFRYVNVNLENKRFYEDLAGKVFANSSAKVVSAGTAKPKTGGCGCSRNK
jgi:hypothetical protein